MLDRRASTPELLLVRLCCRLTGAITLRLDTCGLVHTDSNYTKIDRSHTVSHTPTQLATTNGSDAALFAALTDPSGATSRPQPQKPEASSTSMKVAESWSQCSFKELLQDTAGVCLPTNCMRSQRRAYHSTSVYLVATCLESAEETVCLHETKVS